MPTASVTIAGSTPFGVQVFSLNIEQGLGNRAKRCHGDLWIDTVNHPVAKPLTGQTIEISIEGTQEFVGVLVTATDEWINPVVYKVAFDAMDYTLQLDAKLVTSEFEEQLLSVRVAAILTEYASAFSVGTIDNDVTILAQSVDHREPSAIFDELAELTDQYFELKFDKTVNFFQTGEVAPITSIVIENDNRVGDFVVTEDWSDLHNVTIIKDFTLRSAYTIDDKHIADGIQSFFGLTYPPWSVEDTLVQVSKDGTEGGLENRTSAVDQLGLQSPGFYEMYMGTGDESAVNKALREQALEQEKQDIINGVAGEAYVCVWNEGVRFPACDLPGDGELIRIRYPFERREQALESRNLTSIGVMAVREGTDGIHEKVINLPELRAVSLQSAKDYAEMLLSRGAWPSITGSFQTFVTGWAPGQRFILSSTVREVTDPRPGEDVLNVWVSKAIKRITATQADGTYLVDHEIHFTSQPQAVPIPLDEFLHRLIDRTTRIRPPGSVPPGTDYSTSTSTTTTTGTSTSTSTTTVYPARAILLEVATLDYTTSTSTTTISGTSTSTTRTGTSTSTSTTMTTTTTLAWQSPSSIYSSCGYSADNPATLLIDGNTANAWLHMVDEAHEVVFDLGETKYITKIKLYVYNQDVSQWGFFQVYISDDPNSWGATVLPWGIFRDGEYGAEWVEQTLATPKSGRYLKLTAIDTDDSLDHVMGSEFEVYAS